MLTSVAEKPLLGMAARMDALGLSRRKGQAIKKALVELGYVRSIELPVPQGKTVLLELTDRARAWLVRHRVSIAAIHGSVPHAYWQHRVAETLRSAGWSVVIEGRINGHAVDVVAEREGQRLVVEIETGRSDWLNNFTRLEQTTAAQRWVVWLDPATQGRAQAALPAGERLLRPSQVDGAVGALSGPD